MKQALSPMGLLCWPTMLAPWILSIGGGCASGTSVTPVGETTIEVTPRAALAAEQLLKHSKYREAVAAYDAYVRVSPGDLQALYNRAYALHQLGKMEEAEAGYRSVLERDPQAIDAAINLAACLQADQQHSRAEEVLVAVENGLGNEFEHPELLHSLAQTQRLQEKYEEASRTVRRLLTRFPKYVRGHELLAAIAIDQGEFNRAHTILANALKLGGEEAQSNPVIPLYHGLAFQAQGHKQQAFASFERALAIDASHIEARFRLGVFALHCGHYSLAAESLKLVKEAEPNYEVVLGYGFALRGLRRWREAAETLEEARALLANRLQHQDKEKEDGSILQELVVIYQLLGEWSIALRYADQYLLTVNRTCLDDEHDGFCGRYNGIKLMLKMGSGSAQSEGR